MEQLNRGKAGRVGKAGEGVILSCRMGDPPLFNPSGSFLRRGGGNALNPEGLYLSLRVDVGHGLRDRSLSVVTCGKGCLRPAMVSSLEEGEEVRWLGFVLEVERSISSSS